MTRGFWIAELVIKAEVLAKLHQKHNVTLEELDEAVTLGQHDHARWDVHPAYGRRLIVRGTTTQGRRLEVYLQRYDDDDTWEVKTAWAE